MTCTCPDGYDGDGVGQTGCRAISGGSGSCASSPCVYGACRVSHQVFITARKRSLRRLCFHRCLSVHGGVGLPHCMLGYTHPLGRPPPPPGQISPCADTPPPGQTPPFGRPPFGQTPPRQTRPSCTVHAGIRSTGGQYASHWNTLLLSWLLF